MKDFVIAVQTRIGLNDQNVRATVTTFAENAIINIGCFDYEDIFGFNHRVTMLSNHEITRKTNMRDGLEKGQLSLESCGYNNNVRRIIILITDGKADFGIGEVEGLLEASLEIKAKGTIIQSMTVGSGNSRNDVLARMMIPATNIYRSIIDLNYLNLDEVVNNVCGNNDSRKGINSKNKSCLLYTSPSPRDKRQSRMPSSA